MDQLTEEEIENFREAFKIFDKNDDGSITIQELGVVMKSLGQNPTEDEMKEMIKDIDADGDGEIDFPEFLTVLARKMKETDPEEELMQAFKALDKDSDGLIPVPEIRTLMRKLDDTLTLEEIDEMLKHSDVDRDNYINFAEFVRMMMVK